MIPSARNAAANLTASSALLQYVKLAVAAFPVGQAGRQVSEKEERELLRWKRNKTGRRKKKKRESPMNILEKIQARASEVVVVAG